MRRTCQKPRPMRQLLVFYLNKGNMFLFFFTNKHKLEKDLLGPSPDRVCSVHEIQSEIRRPQVIIIN